MKMQNAKAVASGAAKSTSNTPVPQGTVAHTTSRAGVEKSSAAAQPSASDETRKPESAATGDHPQAAPAPVAEPIPQGPVGLYDLPVEIVRNGFKNKSLSSFACNIAVGCSHGCRFCYVPDASTKLMAPRLLRFGVQDPDADWGSYALLRKWEEKKFMASLRKAEGTPIADLNRDGNRAIMFCSTTDPYQIFNAGTAAASKELNDQALARMEQCLECILQHPTLRVRILTRSPLAAMHFKLFKRFGNRLLFGMSVPTLDNKLARVYEPNAPAPSKRLETLQKAREAGLNVYAALAPTYPECDEADIRQTLTAMKELNPLTIFHEPINIRAENVERIAAHAASLGVTVNTAVFDSNPAWWQYGIGQLKTVERIAGELELGDRLHLWPDAELLKKNGFIAMRNAARLAGAVKGDDEQAYAEHHAWVRRCHARVSEWPQA